jgi:hypothetical protein
MTSRHGRTTEPGGTHRRSRKGAAEDQAARPGSGDAAEPVSSRWADANTGRHAAAAQAGPGPRADQNGPEGAGAVTGPGEGLPGWPPGAEPVARRTANGWKVGDEEVSDLTSAMVLADLLVADLPTQTMPIVGSPAAQNAAAQGQAQAQGGTQAQGARPGPGDEQHDPKRLRETVAQLEHALTARVRVEQAIGVLAERHRLRPRQAFELLRSVARARGKRVLEIATEVVESATNPLLRIPEELAKPPVTRRRGRVHRHTLENG